MMTNVVECALDSRIVCGYIAQTVGFGNQFVNFLELTEEQ